MQETPQVGWDPIAINYHPPLAAKIFVLYLLLVMTIWLIKSVRVLRLLWAFTRPSSQVPRNEHDFLHACEACSNRIQSMKRLGLVTLLLSVLVTVLLFRAALMRSVEQKIFGVAAMGATVEALTVFALGIFVCAVIYAACGLYEGILLRRREAWTRAFGI